MGIISAYLSNNPGNGDNINKIPKNVTNGENNSHNNVNKHPYLCRFKCYWGQKKVTDTIGGYFTLFLHGKTDKHLWERPRSQFCNCLGVDNPWHSSQVYFIQWLPNVKYINKPGNRGHNPDLLLLSSAAQLLQHQLRILLPILFLFCAFHLVNINF